MERARCLRAVSQIAPGRFGTLPLRHYGRCARSSLIKGFGVAQAAPNYREAQPEAEPGVTAWRVPRRSAERRARPQADVRGNATHPWRAPPWLAGSDVLIRSAGAEVDYAPLGAPPPLIFWRQLSCRGLARLGRNKKRAARMLLCVVIAGRGVPAALARRGAPDPAI